MKNTITILSIVKKQEEDSVRKTYEGVINKFIGGNISDVLKIGQPNQIPNQLLFALEVERVKAIDVIKNLTYAGVSIIKNDPSIGAAINEAKFELENQQANTVQKIRKDDELKNKIMKKGNFTVEELAALGDWKLLLSTALNQSYQDIEKSRQIKQILPDIINEAIEKEIERGGRSLGAAKNSIVNLIEITENEKLKRMQFNGNIKKAGDAVIKYCCQYPKDLIGDLIFLANSTSTISAINVKAFLEFYKIVSGDTEKYDYEILVAARHLNTRALDNVHQPVVKLSPEEKEIFTKGIEFFKETRKKI